ncbi:MAG: nucleotide disphospho-sugar-binding domain-containing protein [Frankiaceae bacterium]
MPQGADQFLNADAVSAAGAGLALQPAAADADAIRASVARLLTDESFRTPAQAAAGSIAAMPSPDTVACVLEQLRGQGPTTSESRLLWVGGANTHHSRSGSPSGGSKADAAWETEGRTSIPQPFSQ